MTSNVIPFPGAAPTKRSVTLSLSRGPSLVVEVVREVTPAGLELWHVERYSRFGGPRALVAHNLTSERHAVALARAEIA